MSVKKTGISTGKLHTFYTHLHTCQICQSPVEIKVKGVLVPPEFTLYQGGVL